MKDPSKVESTALVALGRMLRNLRKKSGISGPELAQRVPLSQSGISKLENGKSRLPEWNVIELILIALEAEDMEKSAVRRQYELAQLDPSSYLYMLAHGADIKQRQIAILESSSHLIRDYQISVIPGLLQTPAYGYAVFRELGYGHESALSAMTERQVRQGVLNDPRREFKFVILDIALFSPRAEILDYRQQLEYLLNRISASNISFRILDTRGGVPVRLSNPFEIIDNRFVCAESAIQEHCSTGVAEILAYEQLYECFWEASLVEEESREYIERILEGLGD